jgi:hypothetical protein
MTFGKFLLVDVGYKDVTFLPKGSLIEPERAIITGNRFL